MRRRRTIPVAMNSISKFQKELNAEYRNPETSPLDKTALKNFTGHAFFPVDLSYRVTATLEVTDRDLLRWWLRTTGPPWNFRQYGILVFTLQGTELRLPVYQSEHFQERMVCRLPVFLFTDLTNGKSSYDAGRYIDLRIPKEGNTVVVDFNQAYNPGCVPTVTATPAPSYRKK